MSERSKPSPSSVPDDLASSRAAHVFWAITRRPRTLIALGIALILIALVPLPRLVKDTRADAFLPQGHTSLERRDLVKEIFGQSESIALALVTQREQGVYDPEIQRLVELLTVELEAIPGIDPDRVTSLATEESLRSSEDGLVVETLFENTDGRDPAAMRSAVEHMRAWMGTLVARDHHGTLISAELLDGASNQAVYDQVQELVSTLALAETEQIHVAGDGALQGHLSQYIDTDAKRLNPLAALIIALVLLVAHRTIRGVLVPQLITVATLAVALGAMAAMSVPFYLITNGMLVVLIAISVADGVHILGQYYEEIAARPYAPSRELAVRTMVAMWRPVTITSVTDVAGFGALALASFMPPLKWFGAFAAAGVSMALLFSLTVVPATLTLLRPKPSSAFKPSSRTSDGIVADRWGELTSSFGRVVMQRPALVLAVALAVIVSGVFAAGRLQIDEETVSYFHEDEPIRIADTVINETFDGVHFIDIMIDSGEPETFYEPAALEKVAQLVSFLESSPQIRGVTSLVDLVQQLHLGLNDDRLGEYRLPEDSDLVAQSLLLFEMGADPTTLGRYLDPAAQKLHVRARLGSSRFSRVEPLMLEIEDYLSSEIAPLGWQAEITGRPELIYQWMRSLRSSHFISVVIALGAVFLLLSLSFRSPTLGFLAVMPVTVAVLLVYAVMGVFGIWLAVGTTMFAAIAIGTAVDYAVHTVDRIREQTRSGVELTTAISDFYATTGRALFFNLIAMVLGFATLTVSQVPSLVKFGTLVSVAVAVSFLGSVTILPAAFVLFRPRALGLEPRGPSGAVSRPVLPSLSKIAGLLVLLAVLPGPRASSAAELPDGLTVAREINARSDGEGLEQELTMILVDRRGSERRWTARLLRKDTDKGVRKSVLIYQSPSRVRGTGLLTWDQNLGEDNLWIYLPAMRRVRRISASDRGDWFLGTDFTFEDMKNGTRVALEDHDWKTLRQADDPASECIGCLVVSAVPKSEKLVRQLGYGRMELWVDPELWIARRVEFWDVGDNLARTILLQEIESVNGYITPHRYEVINHKTLHRSIMQVDSVRYPDGLDEQVFVESTLRNGLPRSVR